MKKIPYSHLRTGKAGEYRVASELMKHGLDVFMTITDFGTDLIASNGCKIQVKSARNSQITNGRTNRQIFTFQHESSLRGLRQSQCVLRNDCIVLWAVEQDRFFVFPAKMTRGIQAISLTLDSKQKRKNKFLRFENNWELIMNWRSYE